jgi:hypothetical protein
MIFSFTKDIIEQSYCKKETVVLITMYKKILNLNFHLFYRWFFNDRPLAANLIEEVETASPTEFRESRVKIASVSKRDDGVYQVTILLLCSSFTKVFI